MCGGRSSLQVENRQSKNGTLEEHGVIDFLTGDIFPLSIQIETQENNALTNAYIVGQKTLHFGAVRPDLFANRRPHACIKIAQHQTHAQAETYQT